MFHLKFQSFGSGIHMSKSGGYAYNPVCISSWLLFCSANVLLLLSLLNTIDDDLLSVLNEVVRDNQLASLPFAKSGRAEALLQQRYPGLASIIDRARQAKIDAIDLRIKLGEQNIPGATSIDMREDDRLVPTPTRHRTRPRHSETPSASATPLLRAKPSAIDLIFRMDDDDARLPVAAHPTSAIVRPDLVEASEASPMRTPRVSLLHERLDDPATITAPLAHENIPSSPPLTALGTMMGTTANAKKTRAESENISHSQIRPWGATPLSSTKLDLKDIMGQTSPSRSSNITIGLLSQSTIQNRAPRSFNVRVSQKERRKQQPREQPDVQDGLQVTDQSSSLTPQSPWQSIPSRLRSRGYDHAGPGASPNTGAKPASRQGRPGTTPQLTMRQTVANVPIAAESIRAMKQSETPRQEQLSISTPQVPKPTSANNISSPASASKSIPVQSIHHQPRIPADTLSTFYIYQPLADILSQQQLEKNVIKEAAAKRDLQEIQQEQEFQEWWDQESRRVMEEEAAASAASARGRGRGSGRRSRGRGRGRGASGQSRAGIAG